MSAAGDGPSARVLLRPIGSPITLGMSGLAIASLVQSGFDLHWVGKSQAVQVGLIPLAVPFVMQGLATVLAFLARDRRRRLPTFRRGRGRLALLGSPDSAVGDVLHDACGRRPEGCRCQPVLGGHGRREH